MIIENLDSIKINELMKSEEKFIAIFVKGGCPHCQKLKGDLEKLYKEKSFETKVGYIQAIENKELSIKEQIKGVPTLIFYKDGKEEKRVEGGPEYSKLAELID